MNGNVRDILTVMEIANVYLLVSEDQFNEIVRTPGAWDLPDDTKSELSESDVRPTNSARRIKVLIEGITGMSML